MASPKNAALKKQLVVSTADCNEVLSRLPKLTTCLITLEKMAMNEAN